MSTIFFVAMVNYGKSGVSQNYQHLAIVFRAERPLGESIFSKKASIPTFLLENPIGW
jgi:hypothetical protein